MSSSTELLESECPFDTVYLLKPNKGNGVDDVSSNVVIKSMPYLKIPLLHIFTLSLNQGIFPDKLKVARVIPVLKSGDETSVSNYQSPNRSRGLVIRPTMSSSCPCYLYLYYGLRL